MTVKSNNSASDWKDQVSIDTKPMVRLGTIALTSTFGLFLLWALFVPLSGAVVASGKVISKSNNMPIQHPSGGVVKQILAKDGDVLQKGDLIAIVQPENAAAALADLRAQKEFLIASRDRLRSNSNSVSENRGSALLSNIGPLRGLPVSDPVSVKNNTQIANEQNALLEATQQKRAGELSALKNQLFVLESEQVALAGQIEQNTKMYEILAEQFNGMSKLFKVGHVAQSQVWEIQSRQLELSARLLSMRGTYNSLSGQIDEVQNKIAALNASYKQKNASELSDILVQLESIEEKLEAAQKALSYAELTAPEAGILTNFDINTIGSVVTAGQTIAEVIPQTGPYLVEVPIPPEDVEAVKVGFRSDAIITAFNARLIDPIPGTVDYVSADSKIDETTGQAFFTARIKLRSDNPDLANIKTGMYAQTYIKTVDRTFMSYLLQPLSDSFKKAFNET